MRFNNKNWPLLPYYEIWYTSSDDDIVAPYQASSLPTIVSNTYNDGKGKIKFNSVVTSIGPSAFENCSTLAKIDLPDSATTISNRAFIRCTGLTSVKLSDSTTDIGTVAFYGCSTLTAVSLGNALTTLNEGCFYGCSVLGSITIPYTVTTIGQTVFRDCTNLTNISYTGTMAQWNSITKGANWNYNVPATVVHCTDGDAPI